MWNEINSQFAIRNSQLRDAAQSAMRRSSLTHHMPYGVRKSLCDSVCGA